MPDLPVLVVQGPFNDTLLFGALQTIVQELTTAGASAYYVSAIVNSDVPIDGCQGHPGTLALPAVAETLLPQIQSILGW